MDVSDQDEVAELENHSGISEFVKKSFSNLSGFSEFVKKLFANAIEKEALTTIKDLIQLGISVNLSLNDSDETAIHLSVKKGFFRVIPFLFSNTLDDYNYTDVSGFSYFHVACIAGLRDTVERFIENSVDVNSGLNLDAHEILQRKFIPLHLAARYARLDIVELLLEHQVDIHAIDDDGKTALHHASSIPEIFGDMLQRRTDDEHLSLESLHEKMVGILNNSLKIVQLLIDRGCNVNAIDRKGYTPLSSVFDDPSVRIKKRIFGNLREYSRNLELVCLNPDIVINEVGAKQFQKMELLLKRGSTVSIRLGENEDTILHLAIGNLKIVKHFENYDVGPCFLDVWYAKLIEAILNLKIIDVDAKNKEDKTPMDMAVSLPSADIVRVLQYHGADLSRIEINNLLYPKVPFCLETVEILMNVVEVRNSRGHHLSNNENLAILQFFYDATEPVKFLFERMYYANRNLQAIMEFGTDEMIIKVLEKIEMIENEDMVDLASCNGYGYLSKIKLCNLRLNENVKDRIHTLMDTPNCFVLSEKNSSQIRDEAEKMKSLYMTGNKSLYDVLHLPLDDIYSFYRSSEFYQTLSSIVFRKNFYLLSGMIKGYFTKCLIRKFVSDVKKNTLKFVTSLDDDCCDEISKYLNNKDIQNLLMAAL